MKISKFGTQNHLDGGQSGYGNIACPICQTAQRSDQNALSFRYSGGRMLVFCFKDGCSFADISKALNLPRSTVEIDKRTELKAQDERDKYQALTKANARRLWESAISLEGTKASAYLRGRGITIPLPDCLRFLPDIYHTPSSQSLCAMVADVQPTGGIHRTFFTKQGQRIQKNAKMMLGPCASGAVRLSKGDGPLVVCEGIETGLSVLQMMPEKSATVWAALSTSGIRGLSLPPEPHKLVIASDGDTPGRTAAHVLAERAHTLGWQVSLLPAPDDSDWNDILNMKGETV